MFDIAVISHCEDLGTRRRRSMNEGFMATYLGLKGITRAAEEAMVSRDILIAEATIPQFTLRMGYKRFC